MMLQHDHNHHSHEAWPDKKGGSRTNFVTTKMKGKAKLSQASKYNSLGESICFMSNNKKAKHLQHTSKLPKSMNLVMLIS